jgi:hypothetical protein
VTSRRGVLVVGVYTWIMTVFFGASLSDVVYATQISGDLTEVGDFHLLVVALAVVAGIVALAAAWKRRTAAFVLAGSLALVVAEILVPALLGPAIRDVEGGLGLRVGPWIRLGAAMAASVLAFVGWWTYARAAPREAQRAEAGEDVPGSWPAR